MKLTLKNFCSYIDKTFEFGNDGIVLISGPSGTGKSTILAGINYALYGKRGRQTLLSVSASNKSYSVELEHSEITVFRCNSPATIRVNTPEGDKWEGAQAQDYINNYFGTEAAFAISSYIQQGGAKSFVSMSPADKLQMLEKFALTNVDLASIRTRCTAQVKKSDFELRDATARLGAVKEQFLLLKKLDKSPFTAKDKNYEKEKTDLKAEIETFEKALERCSNTLSFLYTERAERKTLQVAMDEKEKALHQDKEELEKIQEENDGVAYCGDETLQSLQKELTERLEYKEILQKKQELEEDQKRLQTMEENERNDREQELANKKEVLWNEYSEVDTVNGIEYYKKLEKDLQTLERLNAGIKKYAVNEKELNVKKKEFKKCKEVLKEKNELYEKLKKQDKTYSCPECKTIVRIQDDTLVRYDGDGILDKSDIKIVKKDISLLESKLSENERYIHDAENKLSHYKEVEEERKTLLEGYEEDISEMTHTDARDKIEFFTNYKRVQRELQDRITWIETCLRENRFSKTIENFKSEIRAKEAFVKKKSPSTLLKSTKNKLSDEKLAHEIQEQKHNKITLEKNTKKIEQLTSRIESTEADIYSTNEQYILQFKTVRNPQEIETEIQGKETNRSNYQRKIESKRERYQRMVEYEAYKAEEKRVKTCEKAEKEKQEAYSCALTLQKKIKQAESIAVQSLITSINAHVQEYIELFFPSEPIIVRLSPFKQNKKKDEEKPIINFEVVYRDSSMDIDMLSGGETARIVLAFMLAMADMANAKILMLDEPTASLDQDLCSAVMAGIRTNFSDRLVMIIAHQVVSGEFDRTMTLGDATKDDEVITAIAT